MEAHRGACKSYLLRAFTFCWPHTLSVNDSLALLHFSIHRPYPVKRSIFTSVLLYKMVGNKGEERGFSTYIVQQQGALLKTWETTQPMYFQQIESLSSPVILLDPPSWPKSLSRQLTKSEGVTPSLPWAFTEVTSVFVMSNRASASATCSLGFCTVCQPVKIQPNKWRQNIRSSIF